MGGEKDMTKKINILDLRSADYVTSIPFLGAEKTLLTI